jgi:hypothetical protein
VKRRSTLVSTIQKEPSAGAYTPEQGGDDGGGFRCRRGCCWSPFGHSTVRDRIPAWHKDACHCHDPKEATS